MMKLCSDVLKALEGRTLVTAESLTGGGKTLILDETSPLAKIFYGN